MTEARVSQGAPYERLRECYQNFPHYDGQAKDYREKELSDGTPVAIILERKFPSSPVNRLVFRLGEPSRMDSGKFEFSVDADGLDWFYIPSAELKVGEVIILKTNGVRRNSDDLNKTMTKEER